MTSFDNHAAPQLDSTSAETSAPARVTLSLEIATRLLDLLSSDDAFRARFEAHPRAALLEIGHETPAAHLGVFGLDPVMSFVHFEGGLASKEALTAAREKLLEFSAIGGVPFGPFAVCA